MRKITHFLCLCNIQEIDCNLIKVIFKNKTGNLVIESVFNYCLWKYWGIRHWKPFINIRKSKVVINTSSFVLIENCENSRENLIFWSRKNHQHNSAQSQHPRGSAGELISQYKDQLSRNSRNDLIYMYIVTVECLQSFAYL